MTTALLERLADDLSGEIPEEVIGTARLRVFDWLVALCAAAPTREANRVRRSLGRRSGAGTTSLLVLPATAGGHEAAAAMARLARSTEIDDIHLPSCTTPGAVVLPAVLAAAALQERVPARQVLAAVVVGYEAVARIGAAIRGPEVLSEGIWPTLAASPTGAAAAVVRALGGGSEELWDAMGCAGTMTVLGRPSTERHRWLAFGCSVADGVTAGLEAMLERTSRVRGDLGWAARLPRPFDPRALAPDGDRWTAASATCTKPYCAAGQATAAIGLALRARALHLELEAICHVEVFVPEQVLRMVTQDPIDRLSSICSVPYGVALAMTRTEELYDCRREMPVGGALVAGLMGKTRVLPDSDLTAAYPARWGARLVVEMADGSRSALVEEVPVLAPARSWTSISDKALNVLPEHAADLVGELAQLCGTFADLDELLDGLGEILTVERQRDLASGGLGARKTLEGSPT